ncbi:hypothetical protein OKW27_004106 [Paraburkholderia sp. 35.1]
MGKCREARLVVCIASTHPSIRDAKRLRLNQCSGNAAGAISSAVEPLAQGRSRLVDKTPANFLHAGLIPLIRVMKQPIEKHRRERCLVGEGPVRLAEPQIGHYETAGFVPFGDV